MENLATHDVSNYVATQLNSQVANDLVIKCRIGCLAKW